MDTHDSGAAARPEVRQDSGAVVAAGVGCAVLGLCVVLAASVSFRDAHGPVRARRAR